MPSGMDDEVTLAEIEKAAVVLKGVTRVTPLDRSRTLSEMTGIDLYLKLENLQRAGAFKLRGGILQDTRALRLREEEGGRGCLGGEPRPGGGARCDPARGKIHHRDARERLSGQDRRHERVRGQGRTARRGVRRRPRDGARDRPERGRYLRPCLRRSDGGRRAGDGGPGDDGGGTRHPDHRLSRSGAEG